MKRFCLMLGLMVLAGSAWAGKVVYNQKLVNEPGLAYSKNVDLDTTLQQGVAAPGGYGIDNLAVQATYSSATIASQNFIDGTASTATITVVSTTNLHGVQGTNTLTVNTNTALAAVQATDTVNVATTTGISGQNITINGSVITMPTHWTVGSSSTTAATSIAAAINANFGGFSATSSGSTVTITANVFGTAGNAYTLATSTPTALVVGGATFSGGQNAAFFTLNGKIFATPADWAVGNTSSNTAVNIKNLINADLTAQQVWNVTAATTASTVVTLTCGAVGTACNAYTLTSSTQAAIAAVGATFSGGATPAYVNIAGTKLTESTDFTAVSTTTGTAKAISDAIMANSTLNAIINSTWTSAGLVSATSTAVGIGTNYAMFTSTPSALSVSNNGFFGGTNSNIVTGSSTLNIKGHGFTLALPVLYTSSAGTSPGQLVTGTTYYVIPVDANNFKLSTTSTGAVAGTPIVAITTQTATGGGSFTLAPLPMTGTWAFNWQSSDDDVNFVNLPNISTVTYSTNGTSMWDGPINFQWLRFHFVAGTAGAMNIKVNVIGKNTR